MTAATPDILPEILPVLAQPSTNEFLFYAIVVVMWVGSWVVAQIQQRRKKAEAMRRAQGLPPTRPELEHEADASETTVRIGGTHPSTLDATNATQARAPGAGGPAPADSPADRVTPFRTPPRRVPPASTPPGRPARPTGPPPAQRSAPPTSPRRSRHPTVARPTPNQVPPPPARRPAAPVPPASAVVSDPTPPPRKAEKTPAQPPQVHRHPSAPALIGGLDRESLRRAIVMQEVLAPPVSLRPQSEQPGAAR